MGPTVSPQSTLVVLSLVGLALSAGIYGRVARGLRQDGGQVRADGFSAPDLVVGLLLATFFGALVALSVARPEPAPQITVGGVLASSMTFGSIIFALAGYLVYRGFGMVETFGLSRVSPRRVVGSAVILLIGAFPLVALASTALEPWMKDDASEQELVQLFRSAAGRGDSGMMFAVFFAGVVMAPICEELLFRGYFYAVGKRFAGPWISAFGTAAIFAAFHGNLVSFPGLMVLALALTAAYEHTGSLAVPITMHALFNGTSLTILYLQATGRLSA